MQMGYVMLMYNRSNTYRTYLPCPVKMSKMYTALEHVLRHVRDDEFKRQTIELNVLRKKVAMLQSQKRDLMAKNEDLVRMLSRSRDGEDSDPDETEVRRIKLREERGI